MGRDDRSREKAGGGAEGRRRPLTREQRKAFGVAAHACDRAARCYEELAELLRQTEEDPTIHGDAAYRMKVRRKATELATANYSWHRVALKPLETLR